MEALIDVYWATASASLPYLPQGNRPYYTRSPESASQALSGIVGTGLAPVLGPGGVRAQASRQHKATELSE